MRGRVLLITLGSILLTPFSMSTARATESATGSEIEVSYKALFREGLLQGFEANWLFDPPLSELILTDFDINRNGTFERSELVELNKASLPTLHDSGFFTRLVVGEEEASFIAVSGIKASNEGGRVRYRFSLGIANDDLDVRGSEIVAYINDPTTITTIVPARNGAAYLGNGAPSGCEISAEQTDNLIQHQGRRGGTLFGQVHSVETVTKIRLSCQAGQAGQS